MMTRPPLTTSYWPADTGAPVLDTTIGGVLRAAAERAPDQPALIAGDPRPDRRRQWTYGQLLAEAERAAHALARFAPGDPVAVWSGNCPEWVLLEFAAGLAGLTLVPVNPAYQAEELAYALGHCGARGVFLAAEHRGRPLPPVLAGIRDRLPELREVIPLEEWDAFCAAAVRGGELPAVDTGAPALILYTSGTTGRPKAAVLTHRGLTNNARLAAQAIGMRAGEALVNPMPLFHVAGGGLFTLGLAQTLGTHVLMPHFDPGLALELTETYRGACVGGVPTMLTALLGHPSRAQRDLSCVRYALSGGATAPAELVRQVEAAFGVPFVITFAQTESSCSITMTRASDSPADRAETLGRPLPQTEVKIIDVRTGQTVPCGTVGEICTRGYLVMDGYLGDPAATSVAIDRDGWLHTGDLGSMDPRGYCRIEGRIKEMIIRGGENIYPREIEAVLLSHPAVTGAAVVGIADRFWGEVVGAAISTSAATPPTEAELAGFCRARLAAYKVPVRWLFTSVFPLTATGKIRKDVLSAQLAEANAPVTTRGRGATAKILKSQIDRPGDLGQPATECTPATHEAQV